MQLKLLGKGVRPVYAKIPVRDAAARLTRPVVKSINLIDLTKMLQSFQTGKGGGDEIQFCLLCLQIRAVFRGAEVILSLAFGAKFLLKTNNRAE